MNTYRQGYVTVTQGSPIIQGIGTCFLTYVVPGSTLTIGEVTLTIQSIEDNNLLTTTTNWPNASATKQKYSITKVETIADLITALATELKEKVTLHRTAILKTPGQFLGGDVPMTQEALTVYARKLSYFQGLVENNQTTSPEMLRLYRSNNVDYFQIVAYQSSTAEQMAVITYRNLITLGERRVGETYVTERIKWSEIDAIVNDTNLTEQQRFDSLLVYDVTVGWNYAAS